MKDSIFTSALFVCFSILIFKSHSANRKLAKADSTIGFEISGKLFNLCNSSGNYYKIELLQSNFIIDSLIIDDKGAFMFLLKKNLHYVIKISKNGTVIRMINLISRKPKREFKLDRFHFHTDLNFNQSLKKSERNYAKSPIAIVAFNGKLKTYSEYSTKEKPLYLHKQL